MIRETTLGPKVHVLIYMAGNIPTPITNISLVPGNVSFSTEQISRNTHHYGFWKLVKLPLPPGDWKDSKYGINVTCGEVFENIEDGHRNLHGVLRIFRERIEEVTGISPSWIRCFGDGDWSMAFVFDEQRKRGSPYLEIYTRGAE